MASLEEKKAQMQKAWQKLARKIKQPTMRPYYLAAAAVIVIVLLIAAVADGGGQSGAKGTMTAEMREAAEARDTLVVGIMDVGYPPFIYIGYDGEYTGSDYELMKKVCEQYGWELEVKPINWNDRNDILYSGAVDCLWSGFISYGREDDYLWTDPYLDTSDVVVVKKSNRDIKELEDLEDKAVAAVKDTSAYANLESFGLALKRLGCADVEQCMELLNSGEADAVVMTKGEASGLTGVKVLDECLDYQTYAVACRLDEQALCDLIGYALAQAE